MIDILVYLFENYSDFSSHPEGDSLARKLSAVGFDELEIGVRVHLATVTDDRESIVELFAEVFGLTNDEARRTPHALCGTVDQIVEQLLVQRERFGITTIGISASALDDFAPVIERLAGA